MALKPIPPKQPAKPVSSVKTTLKPATPVVPQDIYIVSEGRTILMPGNVKLCELTRIEPGTMTPEQIKNFVAGGFLRKVGLSQAPATAKPVGKSKGKWTFDPDDLKNDSLEDLNVKILERDANKAPYETREEAIALLTQDYEN